jgi:hypothetical protein
MHLIIDLRRKKVKIEFSATQDEMARESEVEVELKMNKRQDQAIKEQIPAFTAKLMHYLTKTNVVLLDSTYETIESRIRAALETEKSNARPL